MAYRESFTQRPQRRERPGQLRLPEGYLRQGYFDKDGNVLPELIQDWAYELAGQLIRGEHESKLTSTQLRRFFNKARYIERKLKSQPFEELKSEIYSLRPLAAYAVGRKTAPPLFKQFIDLNTGQATKSEKDFTEGFLVHFQSIVGYAKYIEEITKGRR